MCTVWHADKYKITFKLVINSRRISRGPVPGRGPAVEKHWFRAFWRRDESPVLVGNGTTAPDVHTVV